MNVDEDSERPQENSEQQTNGDLPNGDSQAKPSQQPKRKLKLKYEEYRKLANMIVIHLRQEEEKTDEGLYIYRKSFAL